MAWDVEFHDEFLAEYEELPEAVQDELLALIQVLEILGPQMKRPRVDTLNGSRHKNMKELRIRRVWRRMAVCFCIRSQSPGCNFVWR
jgi:hypothetical protein